MKTLSIDQLLVLTDFTEKSDAAYRYALDITKDNQANIILTHFAKSAKAVPTAEMTMDEFVKKYSPSEQSRTKTVVEVANLKNGLKQLAKRYDVSAIILGKHENSILENIFGSKAMSLVEASNYPFIIVQHELPQKPIESILFAFNHQRESLQATNMVASMAKLHGATVHLIPYDEHEQKLKLDVKLNEKLIVDYLSKQGVQFKFAHIPRGTLYKSMLISYAHTNNIDMMAAAYLDFGRKSFFQSFIDDLLMYDPEIPVLTVNGPEVMNHKPKLSYVPA